MTSGGLLRFDETAGLDAGIPIEAVRKFDGKTSVC